MRAKKEEERVSFVALSRNLAIKKKKERNLSIKRKRKSYNWRGMNTRERKFVGFCFVVCLLCFRKKKLEDFQIHLKKWGQGVEV